MKIRLRLSPHEDYLINREEKKVKLVILALWIIPVAFAVFLGYRYHSVKGLKQSLLDKKAQLHVRVDQKKNELKSFESQVTEFGKFTSDVEHLSKYFSSPLVVKCLGKAEGFIGENGIVEDINLNLDDRCVKGNLKLTFGNVPELVKTFSGFVSSGEFQKADIVELSLIDPCSCNLVIKYTGKM